MGVCSKYDEVDVELAELEVGSGLSSGSVIARLQIVLSNDREVLGRKVSC